MLDRFEALSPRTKVLLGILLLALIPVVAWLAYHAGFLAATH